MKKTAMITLGILLTIASIGQIIFSFLRYVPDGNPNIRNAGWVVLMLSAVFGWLPIYTFRKYGGVARGSSYMRTSELVQNGVYNIVRHPQYLAGLLMNLALWMIAQDWLVGVFGLVAAATYFGSVPLEEQDNLDKFGGAYESYRARVPCLNFVAGFVRMLRRDRAS
jgi:protein-S-isoprenylcysteine O-methyltransferase Ste14